MNSNFNKNNKQTEMNIVFNNSFKISGVINIIETSLEKVIVKTNIGIIEISGTNMFIEEANKDSGTLECKGSIKRLKLVNRLIKKSN